MRLIAVLAVAVVGCAQITPEQRAERVIAARAPYCEKLGYTPNTDPWRDCIIKAQSDAERNALMLMAPR